MTLPNENGADRSNAFQILADGTQDLAALVGLFAADGVGRYTIDYTRRTDQRDMNFNDSLTQLEIIFCWSSAQNRASPAIWEKETHTQTKSSNAVQALSLPKWLIGSIDSLKLTKAFSLCDNIRSAAATEKAFCQIRDAWVHWDMSDSIFATWLQLRWRRHGRSLAYTASKRRMGVGAWVCRIITDMNGNLHLIPGISLHVYIENCTLPQSGEMIIFFLCINPEESIIWFPRSHAHETQALYQGIEALLDYYRDMPWLAKLALQPFYQQIFNELWVEMLSAQHVLGFSRN